MGLGSSGTKFDSWWVQRRPMLLTDPTVSLNIAYSTLEAMGRARERKGMGWRRMGCGYYNNSQGGGDR